MNFPPQFILWKSVPELPPKKPRKVPCDVNGSAIDPHDTTGFMDYQTAVTLAAQCGFYVGFVLTENDPYFLLDLDGVRDAETGAWDQWSQSVAALFPGGAMEVSISGTGMHIMGRCDAELTRDRRRKFANNAGEFYTEGRFVALGHGMQGDLEIDWTAQIMQVVPQKETHDLTVEYNGPAPDYTGPDDDEVLIAKMLAASGSIASQFGDKASLKELWLCDAPRLAQVFPSQSGDLFDRSSADAALLSHLAFWTGKDFERMDRLFRRSALMRDKYEKRADYRRDSIVGAIQHCSRVYSVPQQSADRTEAKAQRMAAELQAGELLTISEQQEHFRNCIYVASHKSVMDPRGILMDQGTFRVHYGGFKFLMSADGTDPTKNAFEAFTENRAIKFPRVDKLTFRPDLGFQDVVTEPDGTVAVNTFRPIDVRRVPGNPAPFLSFLSKLIPSESDRAILLSYMAAVAQYPGRKFLWAPVVIGTHGSGKSTLIYLMNYIVDGIIQGLNDDQARYTLAMASRDLDSKFNGEMREKVFAAVHEMHTDSFKDQRERQDYLKTLITEPTLSIEQKGVDKYNMKNTVNFFFCSNHRDAVKLEASERRFAVFYTGPQSMTDLMSVGLTSQFFSELWEWLRGDGFAIMADYLHTYNIPNQLDPTKGAQRAPRTTAHDVAVYESMTPAEQVVADAVDMEEQGFRGGWVSTRRVKHLCELNDIKAPAPKTLGSALRAMGYHRVGQVQNMFDESGSTVLWSLSAAPGGDYKAGKCPADLVESYRASQGYGVAPVM